MIDADKTRALIAKRLGVSVERVRHSARLASDLQMDQINELELVLALEEALGIDIPDADVVKFRTVQDVIDYVAARQAKAQESR